mmetsp:Transcript_18555/g.33524  ORF Transcript_18555/g.33524 Transcript_18555/m.33524 type:complete len:186 (-) Transcript_18555:1870-2427(-)
MSHKRNSSTKVASLHSISSHRRSLSNTARDLRGVESSSPALSVTTHSTFEEKTKGFVSVLDAALTYFTTPPLKTEAQDLIEKQVSLERVHQSLMAECSYLRTQIKTQSTANQVLEDALARLASRFMKLEKSYEHVPDLDDSLEAFSEADSLDPAPMAWMESPRGLRTHMHLRSSSGHIKRSAMFT